MSRQALDCSKPGIGPLEPVEATGQASASAGINHHQPLATDGNVHHTQRVIRAAAPNPGRKSLLKECDQFPPGAIIAKGGTQTDDPHAAVSLAGSIHRGKLMARLILGYGDCNTRAVAIRDFAELSDAAE